MWRGPSPASRPKEPWIHSERDIRTFPKENHTKCPKSPVYICQKRPTYVPKKSPESPTNMMEDVTSHKLYVNAKRALCKFQKSPVYIPKKPCIYSERALHTLLCMWQAKSPKHKPKRALYIFQKSPTYMIVDVTGTEPYILAQKSPMNMPKEPYK